MPHKYFLSFHSSLCPRSRLKGLQIAVRRWAALQSDYLLSRSVCCSLVNHHRKVSKSNMQWHRRSRKRIQSRPATDRGPSGRRAQRDRWRRQRWNKVEQNGVEILSFIQPIVPRRRWWSCVKSDAPDQRKGWSGIRGQSGAPGLPRIKRWEEMMMVWDVSGTQNPLRSKSRLRFSSRSTRCRWCDGGIEGDTVVFNKI